MPDIIFKTTDYVFSYRVAGILKHNNKILLQRPLNDTGYALPGVHVSLGETNAETLIREFKEEIDADIKIEKLSWVGEIFFPWGSSGKPCHQICLFYNISLEKDNCIPMNGSFYGIEQLEDKTFKLEFSWIDINDLHKIEVYPLEAKEYLLSNTSEVQHFVYKE